MCVSVSIYTNSVMPSLLTALRAMYGPYKAPPDFSKDKRAFEIVGFDTASWSLGLRVCCSLLALASFGPWGGSRPEV